MPKQMMRPKVLGVVGVALGDNQYGHEELSQGLIDAGE
jgi:hypothetical protein